MDIKLNEYNKKRDFEKTSEPKGQLHESDGSLRFVVQHHLARKNHYDLRLELNGTLLSWAIPKGPSFNPHDKRLAVKVEDHPLEYRNFEGIIPKGEYGGGLVMLWDEGYWEPVFNAEEGIENGSLKFILYGKRLKGKWALVRMKSETSKTNDNWLLIKEKDEYIKNDNGITEYVTSIRTGRSFKQIEEGSESVLQENPFKSTDVQLAKLADIIPKGDNWLYEVKYDGYRILAFVEANQAKLFTRNGNNFTNKFLSVASSLCDLVKNRAMVFDGEMVITDENGRSDFQALQNYMKNPKDKTLTYIIFDLLALDGIDLRNRHLIDRKKMLESVLNDSPENLYYSQHVIGNGEESFSAACKLNLEGIIGKKIDSIYSGTRNGDWIKLKCDNRQEFVIGGYTISNKKSEGISSVLLGVYNDNKEFIYVGRAGTGFSESTVKELMARFEAILISSSPFIKEPKSKTNEKIFWLKLKYIAEVKFSEWTKEGLLRQASFKGLRFDKEPIEIIKETSNINHEPGPSVAEKQETEVKKTVETKDTNLLINGIKIASLDKIIFDDPKITKADVIRYYDSASKKMMPYIENRILSIVRCPKGISSSCFYKKHPDQNSKGIETIPIINSEGEKEDYFYIKDIMGLTYEVQMGTIEFHTWGSRAQSPDTPDIMVFDLDPDENMELEKIRQGVRDIKDLLSELSLTSFLKTSGGKGYHVVVPFKATVKWDAFHDFARRIAEVMEQKWPDKYTSNVRKDKRTGKIFIDWIRNGKGATSIAPYSLRARSGAKVSMPIFWEELDLVAPNGIDIYESLKRINGKDPWEDFYNINQQLKL